MDFHDILCRHSCYACENISDNNRFIILSLTKSEMLFFYILYVRVLVSINLKLSSRLIVITGHPLTSYHIKCDDTHFHSWVYCTIFWMCLFFCFQKDTAATNDPFAPGGTTVSASSDPGMTLQNRKMRKTYIMLYKIHNLQCAFNFVCLVSLCSCVSDPFAAVFGNESFGGGFADFSALAKVIYLVRFMSSVYTALKWNSVVSDTYYAVKHSSQILTELLNDSWVGGSCSCIFTSATKPEQYRHWRMSNLVSVLWFLWENHCNSNSNTQQYFMGTDISKKEAVTSVLYILSYYEYQNISAVIF